MNMNSLGRAALTLALLPLMASADESTEHAVEFRAGSGYRYDSNVSIDEIDRTSFQADNAWLLDVGIGFGIDFTDRLSLELDYDYSLTSYQDLSGFDIGLHQASTGLAYSTNEFDAGVTARYFAAQLDDSGFLDVGQAATHVGRLFGERVYLRGGLTYSDKDFADQPLRDADNAELRADAYYLLDGMRRYVSASYSHGRENSVGPGFDYLSHTARFAYGHQLNIAALPVDLKAALRVEQRDYRNAMPTLGEPREDERFLAGLSAAVPLNRHLRFEAEAEYADNASNLASADYDETVVSVSLATRF